MKELLVIRQSSSERVWAVCVPSVSVVAAAFYSSFRAGVIAVAVVAVAATLLSARIKSFVRNRPVALVASQDGLSVRKGWLRELEIPWRDIEDTGLSYGGRRGAMLNIKVRRPQHYLGWFMRANMSLSRFQIVVSVSGLECSPEQVLQKIEEARSVHGT